MVKTVVQRMRDVTRTTLTLRPGPTTQHGPPRRSFISTGTEGVAPHLTRRVDTDAPDVVPKQVATGFVSIGRLPTSSFMTTSLRKDEFPLSFWHGIVGNVFVTVHVPTHLVYTDTNKALSDRTVQDTLSILRFWGRRLRDSTFQIIYNWSLDVTGNFALHMR